MDGVGRERQQYSGDVGHQLHAIHLTMGESRLPARFLSTWSQGMMVDGYFLDCRPGYDLLVRIVERELQSPGWGPILDHGVSFNFDCYHHYMYSGRLDDLREPYPRLLRLCPWRTSASPACGWITSPTSASVTSCAHTISSPRPYSSTRWRPSAGLLAIGRKSRPRSSMAMVQ